MLKNLLSLTLCLVLAVPAQAMDDILEIMDPVCGQDTKSEIEIHSQFLNGQAFPKWEIRLVKKGNFFNYEICEDKYDGFTAEDFQKGFPMEFKSEECTLAYEKWIHMRDHQNFKYFLAKQLKKELESQENREQYNQIYEVILPVFKVSDFLIEHYVAISLPASFLGLYFFNHINPKTKRASRIARGTAWLSGFVLVMTAFSYITSESHENDEKDILITDENGEYVTETTLGAKELQKILDEIAYETGLTKEQVPMFILFSRFALKKALPKALKETYYFQCVPQT